MITYPKEWTEERGSVQTMNFIEAKYKIDDGFSMSAAEELLANFQSGGGAKWRPQNREREVLFRELTPNNFSIRFPSACVRNSMVTFVDFVAGPLGYINPVKLVELTPIPSWQKVLGFVPPPKNRFKLSPKLIAVLKPYWLPDSQTASLAVRSLKAGVEMLKEDELILSLPLNTRLKRAKTILESVITNNFKGVRYLPFVKDFSEAEKIIGSLRKFRKHFGFTIAPNLSGWDEISKIKNRFNVFILYHPTHIPRQVAPEISSVLFPLLAGADATILPAGMPVVSDKEWKNFLRKSVRLARTSKLSPIHLLMGGKVNKNLVKKIHEIVSGVGYVIGTDFMTDPNVIEEKVESIYSILS